MDGKGGEVVAAAGWCRFCRKEKKEKKMAKKKAEKGFRVKIAPPSKEYTLKLLDMGYRGYVCLGDIPILSISQDGRVYFNVRVMEALGLTVDVSK